MAERAAKTIDERFDEVSQAFREQRDFTIFCAEKVRSELGQDIRDSEGRLTQRLESLEGRFDGLEGRFDGLEGKVDGLEKTMNRRLAYHELLLTEILNEVKKR